MSGPGATDGTLDARILPVSAILVTGIGLGLAADHLLRGDGGPGLNFFLLFAGLAASAWFVARRGGSPLGREATAWIVVGLLCAAALVWRGSGLIRFGTFVAACTAFALPALHAGRPWVRRSGVLDVLEAVAGAGLHAGLGGFRLLRRENPVALAQGSSRSGFAAVVRTAVVGALLALVPLVVFGALFVSADEVFAKLIGDFIQLDLQAFVSHVVVTAILSWLACGYLVGVSSGTRLEAIRRGSPVRPSLRRAEVATALALVDLLFLGFVIVQFRYLFGGAAWIEVTPGLTYANYARAGFFQLVAAVALAIPWLLATHSLVDGRGGRPDALYVGFASLHLILLLAIVASAIQRMLGYQAEYGLSELRIIVMATLVWLTVLLAWLGTTVLSGRRDRFAFGGIVTAFVLVGALQVINPAGLAARYNLDNVEELGDADAEHFASLGSDAAPILVARLGELPGEARCVVASRLLRMWGSEQTADWRSFNWSEVRARAAVRGHEGSLRRISSAEGCSEPLRTIAEARESAP